MSSYVFPSGLEFLAARMFFINKKYSLLGEIESDVVCFCEFSLFSSFVPLGDESNDLFFFDFLPGNGLRVDEVKSIVDLFKVQLFGHFQPIFLDLKLTINYSFALFFISLKEVFFVVTANLKQQLLAFLTQTIKNVWVFATYTEVQ